MKEENYRQRNGLGMHCHELTVRPFQAQQVLMPSLALMDSLLDSSDYRLFTIDTWMYLKVWLNWIPPKRTEKN